jgi:hypothetical protein
MRRRVMGITIALWLVVALGSEASRIWISLHSPPSPELYTNHLSFQLFASAFVLVVTWLPLLAGVLLLEAAGFAVSGRIRDAKSRRARES